MNQVFHEPSKGDLWRPFIIASYCMPMGKETKSGQLWATDGPGTIDLKGSFSYCLRGILVSALLCFPVAGKGAVKPSAVLQIDTLAQQNAAPLFASDEVLEFSVHTDIRGVTRDRGDDRDYHGASITVANSSGAVDTVPLRVRTRGNFRRQANICSFPPIRLNFYKDSTANTVFDGQDRLKLVVHCRDRDQYEQYILQEYLVYRIYNLLTELSFRVRLARVTYVDTEEREDTVTRYAFIIEDAGAMAERNGWQALEVPVVPPDAVPPEHMTLVDVFQYMIGNTDWSGYLANETEEECCHNTIPIGNPQGSAFPVPYDFDITGIVNTRYASPPPNLGIRTVRERLFRGLCRDPAYLPPVFQLFFDRRQAIYDLYETMGALDNRTRDRTIDYLDDFFDTIGDERAIQREFIRPCRRT